MPEIIQTETTKTTPKANKGNEMTQFDIVKTKEEIKQVAAEVAVTASREATTAALAYAETELESLLSKAEKQINERIKPQTLNVTVNLKETKLTHKASPILERLIRNSQVGLNTLLIGPAGCGKTMAAEQLAQALNRPFGHLCLTAGASETWLFGRQTPNGFVEATFSKMYRDGGVFLADEFDAADPNLLLSINTALSGNSMYNPISGETLTRNKDFVFIAAANTNGKGADSVYTGRSRLDGATLTRFVKIYLDYNEEIEKDVCPEAKLRTELQRARQFFRSGGYQEVITTRCLAQAYKQHQAQVPIRDIFESFTLGWPKEITTKFQFKVAK